MTVSDTVRAPCHLCHVFDHPAIEVVLGLIFVYLVLSLLCTAINETISSMFAWRADFLKKGLRNLLDGDVREADPTTGEPPRPYSESLFDHPLLAALIRPAREGDPRGLRRAVKRWRSERYPSYLPSRAVVSALLDFDTQRATQQTDDAWVGLTAAVARIPIPSVRHTFELFLVEAQEEVTDANARVNAFRRKAETWYDDAMARVSGWYRRRIQLVLWLIALVVSIVLNANTVEMARVLWSDEPARTAIAAQAQATAGRDRPLEDVRRDVNAAAETLPLPLGWSEATRPDGWSWLLWPLGIVLTSAALSLGAPFWFDLLSKVARLRSSGTPPPPRQKTETAG